MIWIGIGILFIGAPRVNVSLELCGEEIHRSDDNLLRVD